MLRRSLLVVVAVLGCKSKQDAPAQQAAPVAATPPPVADAKSAEPKPAVATGLLSMGPVPPQGCIAWNTATKTPACITGTRSRVGGESWLMLDILDGRPSIKLPDALDEETANHTNAELVGFTPITGDATTLAVGKPLALPKGASITLTSKETRPSNGDDPPTYKYTLDATCGTAKATIYTIEDQGSEVTVKVRTIDDVAVIESINTVNRENEMGDTVEAARLELASCKLTRAGGT